MKPPLSDVKIVELTNLVTGSLCGQMLGDLGAQIVKIERPEGDPFRSWQGGKYSPMFMGLNRNKKSIVLDLTKDDELAAAKKLIAEADVLIENFRPGVMDRLGLSYDVLKELNGELIYCAISGFGESGPYRDRPAFDGVAQSITGLTGLFVDPQDPQIVGPTISDDMTGIMACYGVLGALYGRAKGQPGRRVDVNMIDASASFLGAMYVMADQLPKKIDRLTRAEGSQAYSMRCGDDKLLALHLSSLDKFWEATVAAFELEDELGDEKFAKRMSRVKHYHEIAAMLKRQALTQPRTYWMDRLEERDAPYAPIHDLTEVFEDPQVQHLGLFAEVSGEGKPTHKLPRRPVWYDGSRDDQPLEPAPLLGEHTDEILDRLKDI